MRFALKAKENSRRRVAFSLTESTELDSSLSAARPALRRAEFQCGSIRIDDSPALPCGQVVSIVVVAREVRSARVQIMAESD
jgi:hypothetical protein